MFHSKTVRAFSLALAAVSASLVWFGLPRPGIGVEPTKGADDDSREAIVRIAKDYKLFLGANRVPLVIEQEPVLRWPNSTRDTQDGATFVWTLDGRPEAIGCIWENGGNLSYAFQSLSGSKLVAERDARTIWHPEKPGIELGKVPNAPPPAESAAKRLVQMKELARRFACRLIAGDRKAEELRLLPRPLYRYKTERKELFDGALFAFVQGTDPEVILVLEAARHNAESEWRYALTRRTMVALEADLDGKPIWALPVSAGAPGEAWFHGFIGRAN